MPETEQQPAEPKQGLSAQTLVIASLSSLAAAIFIHKLWPGGAILGAAFTPIIVSLVSEALRKPAAVLATTTRPVQTRDGRTVQDPGLPPPPRAKPRDDRFGIWEADKVTWRERLSTLDRKHVKLAVATGLVAFAAVAFALTGAELVFGGAGENDRFRIVPGKQQSDAGRDTDEETADPAQPAPGQQPDDEAPAPGTTTPAPGEDEAPAPTAPSEEEPPAIPPPTGEPPSGGEQAPAP